MIWAIQYWSRSTATSFISGKAVDFTELLVPPYPHVTCHLLGTCKQEYSPGARNYQHGERSYPKNKSVLRILLARRFSRHFFSVLLFVDVRVVPGKSPSMKAFVGLCLLFGAQASVANNPANLISAATLFTGPAAPIVDLGYAPCRGKQDATTKTSNYLGLKFAEAE
jgi:hypothetical protein